MYTKLALTLADAKHIAAAAEAEALKNKWNVTIAVLDDGGNLLFLTTARRGAGWLHFRRPGKGAQRVSVQTADQSLR